jgi:hypothetical protein
MVANIFKSTITLLDYHDAKEIHSMLAESFANKFQRDNDRFDKSRFMKACGYSLMMIAIVLTLLAPLQIARGGHGRGGKGHPRVSMIA